MRSQEYMGGEVEIQLDDTVLVVHWGGGSWVEAMEGVALCTMATSMCIMYCEFLNTSTTPKLLLSIPVHAHIQSDQQRALVHRVQ